MVCAREQATEPTNERTSLRCTAIVLLCTKFAFFFELKIRSVKESIRGKAEFYLGKKEVYVQKSDHKKQKNYHLHKIYKCVRIHFGLYIYKIIYIFIEEEQGREKNDKETLQNIHISHYIEI